MTERRKPSPAGTLQQAITRVALTEAVEVYGGRGARRSIDEVSERQASSEHEIQLRALRRQLIKAQEELSDAQRSLARQQREREEESDEFAKLMTRLVRAEKGLEAAAEREHVLQEAMFEAKDRLRANDAETLQATSENLRLSQALQETQIKLREARLEMEMLQCQLDDSQAQIQRLRERIAFLEPACRAETAAETKRMGSEDDWHAPEIFVDGDKIDSQPAADRSSMLPTLRPPPPRGR